MGKFEEGERFLALPEEHKPQPLRALWHRRRLARAYAGLRPGQYSDSTSVHVITDATKRGRVATISMFKPESMLDAEELADDSEKSYKILIGFDGVSEIPAIAQASELYHDVRSGVHVLRQASVNLTHVLGDPSIMAEARKAMQIFRDATKVGEVILTDATVSITQVPRSNCE